MVGADEKSCPGGVVFAGPALSEQHEAISKSLTNLQIINLPVNRW